MLKNYIGEDYLKGYIPQLAHLLWAGNTDYSKQIERAEQEVNDNFLNKGYDVRKLRPELILDDVDTVQDIGSRSRVVWNSTGTGTLKIWGAVTDSDDDNDWNVAGEFSITSNGEGSNLLSSLYNFYYYEITGVGFDVTSVFLVESNYDTFFAYKSLELICRSVRVSKDDNYDLNADEFEKKYDKLWIRAVFWYDESGSLSSNNQLTNNIIRYKIG